MTIIEPTGTDMKQAQHFSFADMPPYLLLAAFNLWLGYALVTDPNSRMGAYLQLHNMADNDVVSRLLGALLLATGVFIMSFRPAGRNGFAACALPILFYHITTAVFIPQDAPSAGVVLIIFLLIYMWQNFEFDAFKQAAETYANRLHAAESKRENAEVKREGAETAREVAETAREVEDARG